MRQSSHFGQAAIAIATVVLSSGGVFAQTTSPDTPVSVSLGLTTSIMADSNASLSVTSPGASLSIAENLSFGLISETRVQSLSLTIDGSLVFEDTPAGRSFGLGDPNVALRYSRDAGNSALNLSVDYQSFDVTNAVTDEGATAADVASGEGTLVTSGFSVGVDLAKNAPLGYSIAASYDDRDYRDTTDPDLYDSMSTSISATANLRFSSTTGGGVTVGRDTDTYANAAGTDVVTTYYSFNGSHELARSLTLTASLGYRQIDTTEAPLVTTSEGIFGTLDAVQDVPNGTIFGGLDIDSSDANETFSLTMGRSLELRAGSLSASVTSTTGDAFGTLFLGEVDYSKEFATGAITFGLTQSISTDINGDDVKFSRIGLGYSQELTSASDLSLAFGLNETHDLASGVHATRTDFSATYRQELTPDWDLSVGYQRRQYSETGVGDASSDAIFLNLSRSIALGF
jgi:hypothetical protein